MEFSEIPVLSPWDFVNYDLSEVLIENKKDGSILLLIPGGKFLAGGSAFEVELSAFYAGLTTVTNAQYVRFLNEVRPDKTDMEKWIELDRNCFVRAKFSGGYEAYGDKEKHPVVQVSWYGAQAYCKWAGGRLPSELEWEKASRFTDGKTYPWGKEWNQSLCRNDKNHGTETTSQVFGYPKGVSPWGLYQMSGNVWEWCQDWYDESAYERYKVGNLRTPAGGQYRVLRGGSWDDYCEEGFRCAYRLKRGPTYRFGCYGFRLFRSLTP